MASNDTNPFLAFGKMDFSKFDPSTVLKSFGLSGPEVEAVLSTQRKNIEALAAANALVVEGVQAFAKRQSEILAQSMADMQTATKELGTTQGARELAAKQAELAKQSFEKAIGHMRELAEIVQRSNHAAVDKITERLTSSTQEMLHLKTWT
jgi:phasin family protein